jgi:hypothetical protein
MPRDGRSHEDAVMYRYVIAGAVFAALAASAASSAAAPAGHWCRQGDPPLYASADTTCELAGSVITDYVNVCHESSNCQIRLDSTTGVDSTTAGSRYVITCTRSGGRYTGTVFCEGPSDTGIWTRFSDLI